jgi:perosamine synthetase
MEKLKNNGVGCSVHWRPLHLHPLYEELGWTESELPVATNLWQRLISLPIYSSMSVEEMVHVVETVKRVCADHASRRMYLVA